MRLGQVAWALGINEKTADNAIRTLGLVRPLDEDTVRALGLALRAKHRYGIPLKRGFPMACEAIRRPQAREKDAVVREVLSYLPQIRRRIRQAAKRYKPLPRGPGWRDPYHPEVLPTHRRHPAIRRAIRWGLDLSLNEWNVRQGAADRLRTWTEGVRAADLLRGGPGTVSIVTMWEGLARAGVRYVVIGGGAGRLHGSARITDDLDVCYDTTPDNTDRLIAILNAWHARLYVPREPNARLPFVIDRRTFRDSPALTLMTDHGRLDLLPVVTGIGDYAACVAASEIVRVGPVELRVLTLDSLIKSKRAASRERDREHLIELEALRPLTRAAAKPGRRRRA